MYFLEKMLQVSLFSAHVFSACVTASQEAQPINGIKITEQGFVLSVTDSTVLLPFTTAGSGILKHILLFIVLDKHRRDSTSRDF